VAEDRNIVRLKWVESQLMVGMDSAGNPLVMGRADGRAPGWEGVRPADLLLLSAASCATFGILQALLRGRVPLKGFEVECWGDQDGSPAKSFTRIHIKYTAYGEVDPRKMERAIQLSHDKYCSVTNTLKPQVAIEFEYEILP
jgi:putative redox protein